MRLFRGFHVLKTTRPTPQWSAAFRWVLTALIGLALLLVILFEGYRLPGVVSVRPLLRYLVLLIAAGAAADTVLSWFFVPMANQGPRFWFDLALLCLIVAAAIFGHLVLPLVVLRQAVVLARTLSSTSFPVRTISYLRQHAVQSLALSFAALISLGTLLLTLPAATVDGRGAPLVDALFTATSATCVTGLIVRDTSGYFTLFGQFVILGLIQLGALGIMTFSSSLAVIFGRRLGLTERRTVSELIEESRDSDIARTVRYVLIFTLLVESLGAVVLLFRWLNEFRNFSDALYHAVFHSVSAFCNAGFSLFTDSFVRYQSDPLVNFTIIGLIITGGLGFTVVRELFNRNTFRRGIRNTVRELSIHARLVITTSGILIAFGTLFFLFFEFDRTLAGLPVGTKLLASLFQSVTPRTAGFNTVPLHALHPATLFVLVMLMFIGASPGGTGGGIKTTTLAVLLLAVRSRLTGREEITADRRTVPRDVVYRATAIAATSVVAVAVLFIVLLASEAFRFQDILFELVSAFGTVGLSTGVTPHLSTVGRLVIIVMMYVGRLGPLTLALAMGARRSRVAIDYPQARIMVG